MKHATSRELFSYWSSIRGQRAAPERSDIDPSVIRGVLADTFILEVDAELDCPLRVVGSRICSIFCQELKGLPFSALWRETDRSTLRMLIASVLDEALPAIAGASAAPLGRPPAELELVLMPLRHNGRTHARLLGALSPGAISSWLGLLPAEPIELTSMRIIGAEEHQARQASFADARGIAAAAAWSTPEQPMRRRHLLVHDGGLRE